MRTLLIVGLVAFALGWFGKALLDGPPPDVTATLDRHDAELEHQEQDEAERRARVQALEVEQARGDSVARETAKALARARQFRARADTAQRRTDAALDLLAQAGIAVDSLATALAAERRLADSARVADSVALAERTAELVSAQNRIAILTGGRAADSTSLGRLQAMNRELAAALKKASRKGLDPAVGLGFDPGCQPAYVPRAIGASVRVIGIVRAGVQVDVRDCR